MSTVLLKIPEEWTACDPAIGHHSRSSATRMSYRAEVPRLNVSIRDIGHNVSSFRHIGLPFCDLVRPTIEWQAHTQGFNRYYRLVLSLTSPQTRNWVETSGKLLHGSETHTLFPTCFVSERDGKRVAGRSD